MARVRAGDERAFELVFDRYHRSLLAFCRRMLAGNEEAEDALQHTFMAAYRALRSSDRPIRLKAWLYTIARNRCLSVLRARREQVALDDGHAASDGLAADVDRRAELRGLLADLEQLPDEQRAALVLFELGDHSHDEIAEVLGVRREKVKALVFQARESLASWRRARETPCVEIREQLATLRGAALKRATLRRHVARCEGCAEFETEVRRQRVRDGGAAAGGADRRAEGRGPRRRRDRRRRRGWGRRGLAGRARRRGEGRGGQDPAVRRGGRERRQRRLRRGARGGDARRAGTSRRCVAPLHRAGASAGAGRPRRAGRASAEDDRHNPRRGSGRRRGAEVACGGRRSRAARQGHHRHDGFAATGRAERRARTAMGGAGTRSGTASADGGRGDGSARRGSAERGDSVQRARSARRHGFADRNGSTQRAESARERPRTAPVASPSATAPRSAASPPAGRRPDAARRSRSRGRSRSADRG